jgi:hypothetical protein
MVSKVTANLFFAQIKERSSLKTDWALGGFNVSNLMGITRRIIDIGKKITFYFLQNVWKCTVFFAFAFKVWKKCCYDPKNFFL